MEGLGSRLGANAMTTATLRPWDMGVRGGYL